MAQVSIPGSCLAQRSGAGADVQPPPSRRHVQPGEELPGHRRSPFLGGTGPAPAYAVSLSELDRAALREALRDRLPAEPDGSIHLTARAWAVRGRAPVSHTGS